MIASFAKSCAVAVSGSSQVAVRQTIAGRVVSRSNYTSLSLVQRHSAPPIHSPICRRPFSVSSSPCFSVHHLRKMSSEKPKIVFVLGAPGAGKGTQCSKIVNEFGYVHLSAGDLLREERQRAGSEYGEMIEDCITNGRIVPVEVTCALLENAINKCAKESGKDKFLVDGFPRNKDNLDGWTKQMDDKTDLQFVLVFDCTEDVCVDRCLQRGAAGSGRTDDNLDSLKKRFNTFFKDSLPIIEHYNVQNLVRKIDGGPGAEAVFEKVKAVFNSVEGSSEKA